MTVVEQERGGGVQNSSVDVKEHPNYARSSVEMTAEGGKDDKGFTSELCVSEIMIISAFDRLNDGGSRGIKSEPGQAPRALKQEPHDCKCKGPVHHDSQE